MCGQICAPLFSLCIMVIIIIIILPSFDVPLSCARGFIIVKTGTRAFIMKHHAEIINLKFRKKKKTTNVWKTIFIYLLMSSIWTSDMENIV